MEFTVEKYSIVRLCMDDHENSAVKIAAQNLKSDLRRVLDASFNDHAALSIVIGTAGISSLVKDITNSGQLVDINGDFHKEAFLLTVRDGILYIVGTDRRGTIYGIYEFCSRIGVSPWHFFADVPDRKLHALTLQEGFYYYDYPSVEYRGIFINDEEELDRWSQRYMGEETIGAKTYEKIFELLLRLRLNYLWPAMHVNSFNTQPECRALADRMGIVIGTSHCDMLMRSNNREWWPWIRQKGYDDARYDYSIPGKNREILKEYWRESIEENKNFEVCYTMGMRGIHDSGFDTEALRGLSGDALREARINLLQLIMSDQAKLLDEVLGHDTMKTFIPYKEVLELYDCGLQIPDDLTMVWVNDNYGFIRRYPGPREKARSGGNGIYYHNSYWAGPDNSASYVFITTIPLAQTRNELTKAWNEGIQKLWVTNFGALKPLEQQITYYARLAWEVGKVNPATDDEIKFLTEWIDDMFTGHFGSRLATLLVEFDQLTNTRKLEHMDCDIFSQTAYGDEAAGRLHCYEEIFKEANDIYRTLPEREKDAFFELFLMKIQAAYLTYSMFYYADRSSLCSKRGDASSANAYTEKYYAFKHAREQMIDYYNHVMADGKWNGILTPEDFPPPRIPLEAAARPALSVGECRMQVHGWNESGTLVFNSRKSKAIDLDNCGQGCFTYEISAPSWLTVSEPSGTVAFEKRIILTPAADVSVLNQGKLVITSSAANEPYKIPVSLDLLDTTLPFDEDGRLTLEAADFSIESGWKEIKGLGRSRGSVLEAVAPKGGLDARFILRNTCQPLLELHRLPTLDSVGEIRVSISIDDQESVTISATAKDSGNDGEGLWLPNVKDNVDRIHLQLPVLEAGEHHLSIDAIDKYFAFSRIVLYTENRRENSLGFMPDDIRLPEDINLSAFVKEFYPDTETRRERIFIVPSITDTDILTKDETIREVLIPGQKLTPSEVLDKAKEAVCADSAGRIRIYLASALAETENASTSGNPWDYCSTSSHDDTGLAMFVRDGNLSWDDPSQAPWLSYKIRTGKDRYQLWVKMLMWGVPTTHLALSIDGTLIPEKELYNGQRIWSYSAEQIWEWVPVWIADLEEGDHEIRIITLSSHLRLEELVLTTGSTLPE